MSTGLDHDRSLDYAQIVVNGRFSTQKVTGVQRYAHEIVTRLPNTSQVLAPRIRSGLAGHLWEQTALPVSCAGRLLWNPNASGPLTYRRQVVTFHDVFPIDHPEWYSRSYSQWYGVMMRQLANAAMHLITVSEYTKSRLVKLFDRRPDEITVIPEASHIHRPATEDEVQAAAKALRLPSRRYILSLSSREKRKNTRSVLRAWDSVYRSLPADVWLVLAGPPAASIYGAQDETPVPPRVVYTGYVPEEHLAGLYTGASLFVFPSLAEGFGLPVLEAMSCGVRCIASNNSSLPEVGGDVIDYVDPADTDAFAQSIAANFRAAHSSGVPYEAAIERANTFSWAGAAQATYQVLQRWPPDCHSLFPICPLQACSRRQT
jgi:glycosyltransferase involved in cell wall biosynthesis